MTGKTASSIHNEAEMRSQRWQALARDQCALSSLNIFAQCAIGFSMYVYGHVSTPGYFSLLLTVPYALALLGLGRAAAARTPEGKDCVLFAAGKAAARVYYALFLLLHFMDGQLAFFALCALLRDVMPNHSVLSLALGAALTAAYSAQENAGALPRLSRFLKWVIGALLLYCAFISIPHGNTAHLFPLFGQGAPSIFKGAYWLCGAFSSVAWPLIMPKDKNAQDALLQKRTTPLRSLFLCWGGGMLLYLVSAWLMPYYALARPQTVGWRLLLAAHMTPSVPAWSMQVMAMLLLLLLALSHSVSQAASLMEKWAGNKKSAPIFRFLAPLLMAPSGILGMDSVEAFLSAAAPFRGVLALFLMFTLFLLTLMKTKQTPGKEGI